MTRANTSFLTFVLLMSMLIWACNKPNEASLDLLSDDWIYANGIDTFRLEALAYRHDSVETYSTSSRHSSIMLGMMRDPLFGNSEAAFYTQIRFVPEKEKKYLENVDSVVISMRYDTSAFYGKYSEPMSLSVYQITDPLIPTKTYYNVDKPTLGPKIGEFKDFIPNRKDSIEVKIDTNKFRYFPQLRFQLDKSAFINSLKKLPDTALFALDTFLSLYGGIAIIPTGGNGMINVLPEHLDSRITIFYSTATTKGQFVFNMGSNATKFASFHTNPAGSLAADFLNKSLSGDSLFMVQSFNGPETEIRIPYNSGWDGKFLNYAVLDLTIAELANDNLTCYYPARLATLHDLTKGHEGEVSDVLRAKAGGKTIDPTLISQYINYFGGVVSSITKNGVTNRHVKMNITEHFRVAQRNKKDIRIRLSSYFQSETADRTIFYGPKHSKYPAKLRLTFSE